MSVYYFRREDNDQIVEVDFETMICQDSAGYITLEDGVQARRVHTGPHKTKGATQSAGGPGAWNRPLVSDAMAVHPAQVEAYREDARKHGFTGVEFVKPKDGYLYDCHISSPKEHKRYVKHRHLVDKNGSISSKVMLSEKDLENARKLVERER